MADTMRDVHVVARLNLDEAEPGRLGSLSTYVSSTPLPTEPGEGTEQVRVGRLDAFLERLAGRNAFSGVVMVLKDDRLVYSRAFGQSNRATETPNTLDTPFNVASLSKTITAAAVMQLVEEGVVSLDDKALAIVPTASEDPRFGEVTVRQLLSHQSGLGSPRSPLQFAPGERYFYSNINFLILGEIIEAKTGMRLEDYFRARIFGPCGMANAARYVMTQRSERLTQGYSMQPFRESNATETGVPVEQPNEYLHIYTGTGMGGYYMSANDLRHYLRCLAGGDVVRPETALLMRQLVVTSPDNPMDGYGFGTFVNPVNGSWGHSGGLPGAESFVETYPSGYSVIAMANQEGVLLGPVTHKLRALFTEVEASGR